MIAPGVMTRIILQRGFLLLAFTGILLSRAQESTPLVLQDTDLTSGGSSAPESSSTETIFPHSLEGSSSEPAHPAQPTPEKSSVGGDEASNKSDSNGERPTEAVGPTTVGHSEGLFRDETLKDSETSSPRSSGVGTFTEMDDPPSSSGHVADVQQPRESSKPSEVTETSSGKDAVVKSSTPDSSSDDPAPSTVPSMDSRSSSVVDRDQQVSTVQTGLTTRTRSLNATRATTEGDDAVDDASDLTTSPPTSRTEDESTDHKQEDGKDWTASSPKSIAESSSKSSKAVDEEMATEVTRDMDTAASSVVVAAIHSDRVEHLIADAAHTSPISLAALSSFSEDSIQPRGSSTSTAQILDASTAPSLGEESLRMTLPKFSELEQEFSDFVRHHSDSSQSSLVTFDPDGMTHNSSQDPDAVTFTPVTFHVEGTSTEVRHSSDGFRRPPDVLPSSVKFTDETTHAFEMLESNMKEEDREREPLSPANNGPHDEPDREELSSKNTLPSTKKPVLFAPTGLVPLANDESEEMMNDSPQFGPIQSKATTRHDKELEFSVSNDLSHPTGASSYHTTSHELGFSTDHQSEQSEFRPVTASTSPLRDSPEPQAPSSRPESVSSTSPNIVPNPAPSVANTGPVTVGSPLAANQSAEAVTAAVVVLQNDGVTEQGGNVTGATSSIAGMAVKTSVSVSLPLSKTPSGSNSTVDAMADDAILSNISGILPFPIHLDHSESGGVQTSDASTDAPSTTPGGLKIRKPKLKIGGATEGPGAAESSTARTRKPFLAPPQRSSTTVGPPVSIFKKSRTRGASITSSTTARPFPQFSTIRVHYASRMPGMVPGGELVFSVEPMTTTVATTTETEEPFSDEPFTDPTQGPVVPPNDDDITLIKVAGCVTLDKGLRWHEQLNNRHSPLYKEKANYVQIQLERLFRTSPIASQVWKIQIDGFSGRRQSRSIVVDFFLYIIKSRNEISTNQLTLVFHDKLVNGTFSRFTVDPSKTTFEFLNEEPMRPPTEAPESSEPDPVLPQWAIAVIVVGAASLIFVVLFAVVAMLGRHHMRRRYSSKLNDEDSDRPGDWETKMAAAYENLAADTIYDAEDLHSDTYRKKQNATYHGRPSKPQRADSWSSSDWSPPPRRPRPQVHRIVY